MKRFLLCFVMIVLLFTTTVFASSGTQNITLVEEDNVVTFITEKAATAWECPTLRAGEVRTVSGVLNITNETGRSQTVQLSSVDFPYDDAEVLEYLNHIYITIRQGETLLYKGRYSAINTTEESVINVDINDGSTCKFTIDMYCDYTYSGSRFADDYLLEWQFKSIPSEDEQPTEEEVTPAPSLFSDPLIMQWLIAAGLTVIVVLFIRRRAY